jgi:hypothetical protein
MKLIDIQKDKIQRSQSEASAVLRDIKQRNLSGADLEQMKVLEQAVQHLEVFSIITR